MVWSGIGFGVSAFYSGNHLGDDVVGVLGVDVCSDLVSPLLGNGCSTDVGEALALESGCLHLLLEGLLTDHGGGHKSGGSHCDGVVLLACVDDDIELDVTAEVDDVESGNLEHDGADVLSDGVDVSLDGADDEVSDGVGGCAGLLELGGEDLDTCVHCVCCSHDVGEEDLLLCEELSDLGDGLGETVVDEGDEVCLLSNCLLCDCLAAFDVVALVDSLDFGYHFLLLLLQLRHFLQQ